MSDAAPSAGKGKIARLPAVLREELNQRMHDGQSGRKILTWLNGLDAVRTVLAEDFEGLLVNDQNLSEWRKTGYTQWRKRRERLQATKELAGHAVKLAEANGGSIEEGAAAIASGRALELLEVIGDAEKVDTEEFVELMKALKALRSETTRRMALKVAERRADHDDERLKQLAQQLDLERAKFTAGVREILTKLLNEEQARAIRAEPGTNAEKIEKLGQVIFGELWK